MRNEQVENILTWYDTNKRDLIFRRTKDPYWIWVSEVMAQQTQIATMLPYYARWMEKYPTIADLAKADIKDVYALWHGLGYYNRATNLVKGAQYIVANYGQHYPTNYQQWLQVNGVGPYIAAAIASICFDEKVASIDGNVNRVVARFNALDLIQGSAAFAKSVRNQVDLWLIDAQASQLNQALMEMGALVCTKANPQCEKCPLCKWCQGKIDASLYPKKKVKKENPIESYRVAFVVKDGKVAIEKPPYSDGLLAGYYRLPTQRASLNKNYPIVKHIFSHKTWCLQYDPKFELDESTIEWVDIDALINQNQLIVAHIKLLNHLHLVTAYFDKQ